jgi:hypothetical protein
VSSVLVLSLGLAAVAAPDGGHWHQGGSVIVFTPLTTPSNPPAGTRGLYLDAASGEFKSITPEGVTSSLETQGGEGSIPAGLIMMSLTSCPGGFAEETTLSGKFVLGTVAANGDVTGTGGADNITPAGTNSGGAVSAHAGTAVADHASHTHTYTDVVTHTHPQAVNSATTGGLSGYTPDTSSNTSTTSGYSTGAPAGAVATGTTAGPGATLTHSVTQPSAHTFTQPTFAGTQFDNRPAFVKVIFCRKT